jgi:hypothetical protein
MMPLNHRPMHGKRAFKATAGLLSLLSNYNCACCKNAKSCNYRNISYTCVRRALAAVCCRVNIAGFQDAKFPTFNGFWSQEVQAPTNIEFRRENIGDKIYNAAVLRSWNLVPQKAGDIRIDGAELVCLVNGRLSASDDYDRAFQKYIQ